MTSVPGVIMIKLPLTQDTDLEARKLAGALWHVF